MILFIFWQLATTTWSAALFERKADSSRFNQGFADELINLSL